MDYNKVEDAVLKKAMEFFKDNAVKFFGIDAKIIAPAETEIKNVEIKTNYMDYLFYTEDGGYLHFQFQTTNKKDDIILTLTFIPLMSGRESSSNRAIESINLAEKIQESNEKLQCVTLLYALFDKFGDESSKKKFKEVVTMTEIGKMIRDEAIQEGIKEGIKEGKAEGKAEILIKLLIKKFKSVPEEYKEKIRKLPEETIDVMATDIFDISDINELEKYL